MHPFEVFILALKVSFLIVSLLVNLVYLIVKVDYFIFFEALELLKLCRSLDLGFVLLFIRSDDVS